MFFCAFLNFHFNTKNREKETEKLAPQSRTRLRAGTGQARAKTLPSGCAAEQREEQSVSLATPDSPSAPHRGCKPQQPGQESGGWVAGIAGAAVTVS